MLTNGAVRALVIVGEHVVEPVMELAVDVVHLDGRDDHHWLLSSWTIVLSLSDVDVHHSRLPRGAAGAGTDGPTRGAPRRVHLNE